MTVSLDAALSGLKVAQQSLDLASSNIANASTPGYTRKTLPQETLVIAGQGVGARAGIAIRVVDKALLRNINTQVSVTENAGTIQSYLARIQDFHGASDSGRALSTQITNFANSFVQLSQSPNDQNLLNQVLLNATQTAQKINNFADLLNTMRNDVETDISIAVGDVNQAIASVARLNIEINKFSIGGLSTATLEDQRDAAIRTIAKYLEVSTYVSNGKTVVITKRGQILADEEAHPLFFQKSTATPTFYYPGGGLNGLSIDGAGGTDIAQDDIGGKLGALLDLRDRQLPTYAAQLDELAQKMADRFQNEGLKMFTDASGNVPANVADPALVGYVGFSSNIKVNDDIVLDPTLIRNGTTGNTEQAGSNEVVRRVAQYVFGNYRYQQGQGAVDISAGALIPLLGLTTQNVVTGDVDLTAYAPDLSVVPNLTLPANFTLSFGGGPANVINVLPTDTVADVVTTINTVVGSVVSTVTSDGSLSFFDNTSITIGNGTMGAAGLAAMGFVAGVYPAPDPSFEVQVGTQTPVTISIAAGDTSVQLLAALNAVPGLIATLDGGGNLVLTPADGGDIRAVDLVGGPLAAMGLVITNVTPFPFRQDNLGADGLLSTGLFANGTLQDYANSIISAHGEEARISQKYQEQENSFLQTLDARNTNLSGVNIDQEMSDIIRIQSAYTAAAKMIKVTQDLLDDLFSLV